jgi:spore maturation protein CgeB
LAADPKSHCLSFPEAESEYIHDVSFVGVEFQNRLNLLKELQLLLESVDSAVIGPNWTLEARFVQPMKVTNQEAAQISNRSRIVLNMGRSLDLANSRGIVPSTPGPRAFEVGGCSTVQLVTWDQPEIEEYYVLGEEIIFCDSVASIKDEVRDLVMNRRRREAIANASFKRTMSCHLYDHRMQEIVGRIHTLLQ